MNFLFVVFLLLFATCNSKTIIKPVNSGVRQGESLIQFGESLTFVNREAPCILDASVRSLNRAEPFALRLMDLQNFKLWITGTEPRFVAFNSSSTVFTTRSDQRGAEFGKRLNGTHLDGSLEYFFVITPSEDVTQTQISYSVSFDSLETCFSSTIQLYLLVVAIVVLAVSGMVCAYRVYREEDYENRLDFAMRSGRDPSLVLYNTDYIQTPPWDERVSTLAIFSPQRIHFKKPQEKLVWWIFHCFLYTWPFRPFKNEGLLRVERWFIVYVIVVTELVICTVVRVILQRTIGGFVGPIEQPFEFYYKVSYEIYGEFLSIAFGMLFVAWFLRAFLTRQFRVPSGTSARKQLYTANFPQPLSCFTFSVKRSNIFIVFMLLSFTIFLLVLFFIFTCNDLYGIAELFVFVEMTRGVAIALMFSSTWYFLLFVFGTSGEQQSGSAQDKDCFDSSTILLDPLRTTGSTAPTMDYSATNNHKMPHQPIPHAQRSVRVESIDE